MELLIVFIVLVFIFIASNSVTVPVDKESCEHAFHKGDLRKHLNDFSYVPKCCYCGELMDISEEEREHEEKMKKFYQDNPEFKRPDYSKFLI